MNACPKCGLITGVHGSTLPGCMCLLTPQRNDFNPDWDAIAVMVEEQQRMAKRIEELTQLVTSQGIRLMDAETRAECDGGQCGIGGYCKQCPKTQPEPEPVAWTVSNLITDFSRDFSAYQTKTYTRPLYTAPPQREWQGLTDKEYEAMAEQYVTNCYFDTLKYAQGIEAKLKEKNT